MTTETQLRIDSALDSLAEAREAYDTFIAAWQNVGQDVRHINDWLYHRVDAYPGWNGSRDVGAGKGMTDWMTEVEESLIDERDGETEDADR